MTGEITGEMTISKPKTKTNQLTVAVFLCLMPMASIQTAWAESPFVRPAELDPDIRFWTRIYTEVDTDGGLLHDEYNLGAVYEVLKFPAELSPAERARRVKAAKEKYRAILLKLAAEKSGQGGMLSMGPDAERVRALWPQSVSARTLQDAADDIRFQLGQANRFREGLIRSGAYEAHIAETFANMGLPPELAALPHVESSFNPAAYSHAGAAGLWQFIRSTGRRFMRIDAVVDERMDPYRSTEAAAKLLKFNYDLLGTWPLALTAYNHGAEGMRRAKEQLGTDDILTIVRKYQSRSFGFASRNYYIAFLAALDVDRNAEQYFGSLNRHPEVKTRPVVLPAYIPVKALERAFGIDRDTLRVFNPALTKAVWMGQRYVPRGFELRLPENIPLTAEKGALREPRTLLAEVGSSERFEAQKADLLYRVRRNDTWVAIAAKHGTTVAALERVNGLEPAHRLRHGELLRLPQTPEVRVAVAAVAARPPQGSVPVPRAAPPAAPTAPVATIADAEAQPEELTSEKDIEQTQSAEPVSAAQAEALGPQLIPGAQSPLSADPSDYTIAEDLTIEVQAAETLGHYAEWLDLRASELRALNKIRHGRPVVIGSRLKIDLAHVSVDEFERRRRAFHRNLEEEFFLANRIASTEVHVVRRGESLWLIAQKYPRVPIWLLRQHNPDIDFNDVHPGTRLVLPLVETVAAQTAGEGRS
jgi:membrane-bound lytic murein transglycosylase D